MRWLAGGLVVGAIVATLLYVVRAEPSRTCSAQSGVILVDAPSGAPLEGERDPAAAAGWVLEDTGHVLSEPENPADEDDRVTYYSYGGDRSLDQVVVVEREGGRWFATRDTTCSS